MAVKIKVLTTVTHNRKTLWLLKQPPLPGDYEVKMVKHDPTGLTVSPSAPVFPIIREEYNYYQDKPILIRLTSS